MKKRSAAELRTIDIFTGKTRLEEAEDMAREEDPMSGAAGGTRDIVLEAEEGAIRWLGLDAFAEGDDIKVAVHQAGHAVVVLVRADAKGGARATVTFKLSRTQWSKLRRLVQGG
jgi:hypothetical protein